MAPNVNNARSLKKAIAKDKIARIVRHYDKPELLRLFPGFQEIITEHISHTSPSGYPLDTVIMTLQKLNKARAQPTEE